MHYIYHRVPKDMTGDILFPLNILKEKYPAVYEKQVKKYVGREEVMSEHLPILNCLWNDVLHFSAVHPSLIKEALIGAGKSGSISLESFEIDPHLLDPEKTIVFLNNHEAKSDKLNEDNFVKFNPDDVAKYSVIPKETNDYYKEMHAQGKNPLLFHKIPHILYFGSLDVSKLKRVLVS